MARVAVVGVGAIGGVIAALLETTGQHEITLCTRRPMECLRVDTPDEAISIRVRNLVDPRLAQPMDWVLVATKTYDAEDASKWFRWLCRGDTPVAILQNGVEHRKTFEPYVMANNILPIIIDCPAERKEDDSVKQTGPVLMQVETGPLGNAFASLFQGTKAEVELSSDFLTAAWRKLCMNSVGAISALLMKPTGILRDAALGKIALDLVAECVAVGRAEGAMLTDGIGLRVLERYRAQPPDSINSILADRIAGRPMEIDSRNGVIIRKGDEHGVMTPANRMIVALLKASTRSELGIQISPYQ